MRLFVALALVTGGCGGDDPEPDPVAADLAGVDAPSFDVELPEADAPPSDTIEDGTAPPPDPGGEDPGVEDLPPPPEDTGPTAWRSALYPVDWTPATTDQEGRFLHDFPPAWRTPPRPSRPRSTGWVRGVVWSGFRPGSTGSRGR